MQLAYTVAQLQIMFWYMMSKQVREAVGCWMRVDLSFKSHSLCGDWQAVDRSIVAVFSKVPGPLQLKWILWSRRSVTRIKQSQAASTLMQMNKLHILTCTICCLITLLRAINTHTHTHNTHTHLKCVGIMIHEVCECVWARTRSPVPGPSAERSTLTELIYNVWTPPGGTGPDMCRLSAWLTKLSIESGENLLCFSNASVIMTY